jgi:hypothetical protein
LVKEGLTWRVVGIPLEASQVLATFNIFKPDALLRSPDFQLPTISGLSSPEYFPDTYSPIPDIENTT